jgi:hypothetical protein
MLPYYSALLHRAGPVEQAQFAEARQVLFQQFEECTDPELRSVLAYTLTRYDRLGPFDVEKGWDFRIILSQGDGQARLFRTRYASLFEDRNGANRGALALLDLLTMPATLYILPDGYGWSWELWQPADTDKADVIIESMLPPGGLAYGAAQGDGILWAERLGMEL